MDAFLYKQLQSIEAWRGSLVDKVIEKIIILRIKKKIDINEPLLEIQIKKLIKKQLDFAFNEDFLQENMTKTKAGDSYCALYELFYQDNFIEDSDIEDFIIDEKIDRAIEEIYLSINNLLSSDLIENWKQNSCYLIPQRTLQLKFLGVNIVGTPDLIIFCKNKNPTIIDWKVHRGLSDYWLQLGIYSYLISNIQPHSDFPNYVLESLKSPNNINLIEYQLLHNLTREYKMDEEKISIIENYIFDSIEQMKAIDKSIKQNNNYHIEFQPPRNIKLCSFCNYKKICNKI